METSPFENLRRFFERVKNVGFFERLFSWGPVVSLGYDAFGEYQKLQNLVAENERAMADLTAKNRELAASLELQGRQVPALQQQLAAEQGRAQMQNERMAESARLQSEKITEKEGERAKLTATLAEVQQNADEAILRLKGELVDLKTKNEDLQRRMNEREKEAGGLIESDKKNRETIQKLNLDLSALSVKNDELNARFTDAQSIIAQFRQKEEERLREHDQRVASLESLRKQLEDDRHRVQEEIAAKIRGEHAEMELTWKKHEETVEQSLRSICQRHTIEYCDKEKFPVAGKKPDNSVVIAEQYVIFDAKSPKNSEELGNFPGYLKLQAEAAKKYAKEENVKKDIFLVVPANTVEILDEFHFDMADYQVYVVTHESLEPIVLALRKLEEYQFVDQLSPEDREKICHVIGKFAHATKRRMQIDTYFFNEFLDLLRGCDTLPDDILKKVVEFEKAEKMNPPMEKRKKLIPIKDLEHDVKVITKKAEAEEIDVAAVTKERIEMIPLDKYLE